MIKTKVIEIDVAKLDPNAIHLIVFNKYQLTSSQMKAVAEQLISLNVKAVFTMSDDPQNALKVYQIPKDSQMEIKK